MTDRHNIDNHLPYDLMDDLLKRRGEMFLRKNVRRPYLYWITKRVSPDASVLLEPLPRNQRSDFDTLEHFYYTELDQKSNLYGRALAHGLIKEKDHGD